MAAETILVAEDEADLRLALQAALEDAGYRVIDVGDGDEAIRAFYKHQPDLALLDVMMPGQSGMDLCRQIRSMSNVPVIIFSALGGQADKLAAFERGADDYVVKGVGIEELLARVRAVLRRAQPANGGAGSTRHSDAALHMDFIRRAVAVRGQPVELTPTEFKLLEILVKNAGQPFSSRRLLRKVWGPEYHTDDLVKWHIGHLRRKIEEDPDRPRLVVTRRGYGYVYAPPGMSVE